MLPLQLQDEGQEPCCQRQVLMSSQQPLPPLDLLGQLPAVTGLEKETHVCRHPGLPLLLPQMNVADPEHCGLSQMESASC